MHRFASHRGGKRNDSSELRRHHFLTDETDRPEEKTTTLIGRINNQNTTKQKQIAQSKAKQRDENSPQVVQRHTGQLFTEISILSSYIYLSS